MSSLEQLRAYAGAHGVAPDYWNIWGERTEVSAPVLRAVLAAMGLEAPAADEDELEASRPAANATAAAHAALGAAALAEADALAPPPADRATTNGAASVRPAIPPAPLPPAIVLSEGAAPWTIDLGPVPAQGAIAWEIVQEQGTRCSGQVLPGAGAGAPRILLPPLPAGYHRISLQAGGRTLTISLLIVVPARAYWPAALQDGRRVWGPSVQLYALRSRRGWGMGDFTDLAALVRRCAQAGAALIALNPLHALRIDAPAGASPYSPSSRRFLNVLYIDVEAVEDFAADEDGQDALRGLLQSAPFAARLARARAAELIDYEAVAACKREALELAYARFRARVLDDPAGDAARRARFRAFQSEGGLALRRHALFESLQERFGAETGAWGWPAWPPAFHDPHGEAASRHARERLARVEFFEYLQWIAADQLGRARQLCAELGLGIGLYQDLAVSVDPGGSEAWSEARVFAGRASIGCPPDDFNLQGQDWGLPPFSPVALREAAFAPYIAMLRACMRNAGALRIDHVMGLSRLFWIPREIGAGRGAYVSYPFDELLGILALESRRNRCMVVGEDLGTVPDSLRQALHERAIACYRVLLFTRGPDGGFAAPWQYPGDALATATTHDLATLAGWWEQTDIDLREQRGLFAQPGMASTQRAERALERRRLLAALRAEGLIAPLGMPDARVVDGAVVPAGDATQAAPDARAGQAMDADGPMTEELQGAVQEFLARSNAPLLAVQLDDIFGCREQVNLPGTVDEYPNWRRRLPVALEDWDADGRWDRLARRIAPGRSAMPAVDAIPRS